MVGAQCFHRIREWLHFSSFEDMQVGTVHGNTHFSGSLVLYSVRKKTTVSKKKNNCECKVRMFSEFWLKASAADCMYLI